MWTACSTLDYDELLDQGQRTQTAPSHLCLLHSCVDTVHQNSYVPKFGKERHSSALSCSQVAKESVKGVLQCRLYQLGGVFAGNLVDCWGSLMNLNPFWLKGCSQHFKNPPGRQNALSNACRFLLGTKLSKRMLNIFQKDLSKADFSSTNPTKESFL